MTIPMDNTLDNLSRDRAQHLYNKNVELEKRRRKAAQARIPSDPNAWQQMRENYEAIVLEDHAFSEQHEIEYALWQLHYRRIEELRAHFSAALTSSQNGKVPTRPGPDRVSKIRSQFKTFLSEATGFYHDLMVKIRAKYGLPLDYFSDDAENQIAFSKDGNSFSEVKKGLISCHRCLIYLGDLARYKGLYGEGDAKARDFAAASSYYLQASSLCPSSGNPHHQLAIVASYSGDELVSIYRYFRSLAVDNPFTTARENLIIAFEKNRQSYSQLLGDAKAAAPVKSTPVRMSGKGRGKGETRVSIKDNKIVEASLVKDTASSLPETSKAFNIRFVRLNGVLFTRTSLETFGEVFSLARSNLLELLASGPDEEYNFGSDAGECRLLIVRLIAILIFIVHNVNKETDNQSYAEILQRSVVLQNAFTATYNFMGCILERIIHLRDPSESYLLPGIMIFVEWLACRHDIAVGSEMEEKESSARSLFWNHCVPFLNKLLLSEFVSVNEDEDESCFFNMSRYDEGENVNQFALNEDFELRGFVPLSPAQRILDFSRKHSFGGNKEKKARILRIIAAGKALANVVRVGQQGFYFDPKSKRFVIGAQPQISDDYSLASSLEIPMSNVAGREILVESQTNLGILNQKAYIEEEEEDEVILFKPSVTEKPADGIVLNSASSELNGSGVNASNVDVGNTTGSFSAAHDGFLLQNSFNASSGPPTSFPKISAQYLQPIQQVTSKWMVEEEGFIANGLANLNVLESGFSRYPFQVQEASIPSKFDSIMSLGPGTDNIYMKPSSAVSAGLKKSPVSRPIRHLGPPPGFTSATPKSVNPPVDDYSWLDGYRFPSSKQTVDFNNSVSHPMQVYDHPVINNGNSTGMVNFPFPGKQVSSVKVQMENQNGWQNYKFPQHLKVHHQQQQQLQNGNQQPVELPHHHQHQVQSLWDGRFIV